MQPSLAQSFPESDPFTADTFHCSQDSFNPNSQSLYALASTQDELTSSTDSEQFSSFKPQRNLSRISSAHRNVRKKVRFADDQSLQKDDATEDFEEMPQVDMNATCPVDFGMLDSSYTPPSQQNKQQTPDVLNNKNIFTNKNLNANTINAPFLPTNGLPSVRFVSPENKDTNSNPDYTYIMREMVVKTQDNLVSYTYQKSYHDNQLNSSIQQSVHMNDDVIPNIVLEQKEHIQDLHTGDVRYNERRAVRGLGAQRFSETFARKYANSNTFSFDAPDSTYQFSHHGNQMHSQEFDAPSYQSSQHSEFGNPMSDSFSSECPPSSQHSFASHHDDEFVPNDFSELRIKSNNFANAYPNNFETISDSNHSKRYSSQHTPTRNLDESLDNSFSPESSLEFTPIISKLKKQLSLESNDLTNIPSGISDLNYL